MAVIVRRLVISEHGGSEEEITYRSVRHPISHEDRIKAEELDKFLAIKMKEILQILKKGGFLDYKKGDLKRWYALGECLAKFIDDPMIISPEDRMLDRYIWEALWYHSSLGVRPGPPNTNTGTARDHFRLCYELQKIPFDIASQFMWSDWVNFLETPVVIDEPRITKWVWRVLPGAERAALRNLTKVLRNQFRKRDLSVLSEFELEDELKDAWSQVPDSLKYH